MTIASDNSDTAKAKVGDTVTVSIIGSEFLTEVAATINGNAATVVEGVDDKHFEASYVMASGDTEGAVTFSVSFKDIAGRAGTPVAAVTDASAVTFDKTAPTAAITYSNDGGSNFYSNITAAESDTLIVKATFSESLLDSPIVKLAIDNSVLSATDMTKVSATVYTYEMTVGSTPVETATCSLSVGTDLAGNAVVSVPTSGGTFTIEAAPANAAPTISNITAPSSIALSTTYAGNSFDVADANGNPMNVTIGGVDNHTIITVGTIGDGVITNNGTTTVTITGAYAETIPFTIDTPATDIGGIGAEVIAIEVTDGTDITTDSITMMY